MHCAVGSAIWKRWLVFGIICLIAAVWVIQAAALRHVWGHIDTLRGEDNMVVAPPVNPQRKRPCCSGPCTSACSVRQCKKPISLLVMAMSRPVSLLLEAMSRPRRHELYILRRPSYHPTIRILEALQPVPTWLVTKAWRPGFYTRLYTLIYLYLLHQSPRRAFLYAQPFKPRARL